MFLVSRRIPPPNIRPPMIGPSDDEPGQIRLPNQFPKTKVRVSAKIANILVLIPIPSSAFIDNVIEDA